jgi:hypothetical protein
MVNQTSCFEFKCQLLAKLNLYHLIPASKTSTIANEVIKPNLNRLISDLMDKLNLKEKSQENNEDFDGLHMNLGSQISLDFNDNIENNMTNAATFFGNESSTDSSDLNTDEAFFKTNERDNTDFDLLDNNSQMLFSRCVRDDFDCLGD